MPITVEGSWNSKKPRMTVAPAVQRDERLRQWLDHLPALGWTCGADGRCIWFNRAWRMFVGEVNDEHLDDLRLVCAHIEDRERCAETYAAAFKAHASSEMIFRARRHDGSYRWLFDHGIPLHDEAGEFAGYMGISADVTDAQKGAGSADKAAWIASATDVAEQRAAELTAANEKIVAQMQERLRLENALLDISEQEQRRLGQDLHDGLCQSLSGLALMGRSLTKTLEERGLHDLAAQAQRLAGLIHESAEEARDAARGLHPVVMDSEGLVSALHELAARTHGQVRCRLRCERVVPIADNGAALHLYRIAQEAVVNALKHANARCITLSLRMREHVLLLGVSDDGSGMPEVLLKNHGMGIRLMQYRADVIGADFSIRRRRNGGTRITCALHMPTTEGA